MIFDFTLPNEIWRNVPTFPGYFVSSFGRLASTRITTSGRLMCFRRDKNGYAMCTLYRWPKNFQMRFGRLLLEVFKGESPGEDFEAAHEDGNRDNNHIDNLNWKSPWDNNQDKIRHGTSRAHVYYFAKLTEENVPDIRIRKAQGETYSQIAQRYNVNWGTIRDVCKRRTWKHVP